MPQFECDIEPETQNPRVRFNFPNGWTASVMFRTGKDRMNALMASVAAFPTGQHGTGKTILGETEARADEVLEFLNETMAREKI